MASLVGQLDLERYKATIKGLTQFGDRRQGTERNRKALDWIEAQLKTYGCTNTERLQYQFTEPRRSAARPAAPPAPRSAAWSAPGQGGSTLFGNARRTGVNTDPMAQPDERLRALNAEPTPQARPCARTSTARRSAPPSPTRCTSSAPTWTASAGARRPTTMAPARRW